jgi:vacuolar-type H+-ATPase subunit I/STV1
MKPNQPDVQLAKHQKISDELKKALAKFVAVSQALGEAKGSVPGSVQDLLNQVSVFLPMLHGMQEVSRIKENLQHYVFRLSGKGMLEANTELDALNDAEAEITADLNALNDKVGKTYQSKVQEEISELQAIFGDAQSAHYYWLANKGGSPAARDRAKQLEKSCREACKEIAEGYAALSAKVSVYDQNYLLTGEKLRVDVKNHVDALKQKVQRCTEEMEKRIEEAATAAAAATTGPPAPPTYADLKANLTSYNLVVLLRASEVTIVFASRYVSSFDDASRGEYGAEFTVTGTNFVIHTHHRGNGKIKFAQIKHTADRHRLGVSQAISDYYLQHFRSELTAR